MTTERPRPDDEPTMGKPAAPRREPSRFSDWGPDYGPEIIEGYEEPPYDEPDPR
ncbi:hypothetical protein GKC29_18565 [Micromonospora sp. WMMC415]|uniref:hypothetical protein n=1 Tax=Micromonospora sp. WMMC415 TaxID=2675222 RepID=UPI0012B4EF9F|nr:hypothetical protein [Micromonospora sp. WMMC415]QGN48632.1 hypothetical protein GKC29_18565 [Micromonospora sp. WMMC415]